MFNAKLTSTMKLILIIICITHSNARPAKEDQFVLIEGDMMVERWFVKNLRGMNKRGAILNRPNSQRNLYWTGHDLQNGSRIVQIPYTLNFGFLSKIFGNKATDAFNKAIEQYHKRTCLRFQQKASNDKDYIEIFPGTGCWSQIGRRGGKQQLSLGTGCETRGRAIHELMHSIGFLHEQSRLDRDQHVIVLSENIQNGKQSQFKTYRQNTGDLPYDFHSIMHYSNTFFSKDGNVPTIQALIDSNMQLGLTDGFSALDVVRINMLYKCPQLRTDLVLYFVTVYTADETFAGTDSKVDILLSGTDGDSGEIVLEPTDEIPNPFERGSKETFPVIVPNIGSLVSLRIRLAGSSWWWTANDWFLSKVEVETPDDRKKLKLKPVIFSGNKWLKPGDHVLLMPRSRR
ncbi:hatching enzyme 1.2-like [Montipora capricornis]|uniref:hatching enzyme 1.2-like n=1 Tax=Montipora capricornis TaxID=246305 RepID=UPI0035F1B805